MTEKLKDWDCITCSNPVQVPVGFKYEMCCSGLANGCGCMGMPTNPVSCEECVARLEKTRQCVARLEKTRQSMLDAAEKINRW